PLSVHERQVGIVALVPYGHGGYGLRSQTRHTHIGAEQVYNLDIDSKIEDKNDEVAQTLLPRDGLRVGHDQVFKSEKDDVVPYTKSYAGSGQIFDISHRVEDVETQHNGHGGQHHRNREASKEFSEDSRHSS